MEIAGTFVSPSTSKYLQSYDHPTPTTYAYPPPYSALINTHQKKIPFESATANCTRTERTILQQWCACIAAAVTVGQVEPENRIEPMIDTPTHDP